MLSYSTTFNYKGKDYTLSFMAMVGNTASSNTENTYMYQVLIGGYYIGRIYKKDGVWKNLDGEPNATNLPFVPTDAHYQRMGEIIEKEMPEV